MNSFKAQSKDLWWLFFYERSLDEKNFNYSGRAHAVKEENAEPLNENTIFNFSFSRYKYSWNNVGDVNIQFPEQSIDLKPQEAELRKIVIEGIKGYEDGMKQKSY